MSRDYGVYADLGLLFNRENVQIFIQNVSTAGFVYLVDGEDKKLFDINSWYLNVDQAVTKLFAMAEQMSIYDRPFLHVKYQDTDFFFRLYEIENRLMSMGMGGFGFRWDKQFEYGSNAYTVDFARYIRLLLIICPNVILLKLETYSDVVENMHYVDQGCVTVLIRMGPFEEAFSGSLEGVRGSFTGLICNGFGSKFIFFDENFENPIEPSIQQCYDLFKMGFSVYLYAKKDDILFKFEIKRDMQEYEYDSVSMYPLEPYRMKKGYGSEEEKIDVAFYVQRLLELCENFAIYELKTFF